MVFIKVVILINIIGSFLHFGASSSGILVALEIRAGKIISAMLLAPLLEFIINYKSG